MNHEPNDTPAQDPAAQKLAEEYSVYSGFVPLTVEPATLRSGAVPFDETTGRWADDPVVNKPLAPQINREFSDCGPTLVSQFSFSDALRFVKKGERVQRAGWNGKGMFIFLVPGSKFIVNRPPLLGIYPEGTEINYHGHIDMKTADNMVVPWLASQTDILAEDWQIV